MDMIKIKLGAAFGALLFVTACATNNNGIGYYTSPMGASDPINTTAQSRPLPAPSNSRVGDHFERQSPYSNDARERDRLRHTDEFDVTDPYQNLAAQHCRDIRARTLWQFESACRDRIDRYIANQSDELPYAYGMQFRERYPIQPRNEDYVLDPYNRNGRYTDGTFFGDRDRNYLSPGCPNGYRSEYFRDHDNDRADFRCVQRGWPTSTPRNQRN